MSDKNITKADLAAIIKQVDAWRLPEQDPEMMESQLLALDLKHLNYLIDNYGSKSDYEEMTNRKFRYADPEYVRMIEKLEAKAKRFGNFI